MNQENYLFHTQTQILRTKGRRLNQSERIEESDRLRLTNEHYNYRHKNKTEATDLKKLRFSLYTPKG